MRPPALYRTGARLALLGLPLAARLDEKTRRGLAARRGLSERLSGWAAVRRDPARTLVWMHAPSVGEGLHARPVLERLRSRHPDWQLFYTHFSPSAEAFAKGLDVDGADYLPFDTPHAVTAALDALRPNVLVYAHADVWPELTLAAVARGVPVSLISAVVQPDSSRLRQPARLLLRRAYRALSGVGAAGEDQLARLERVGVRRDRIVVLGDTRYDSAAARGARAGESEWVRRCGDGHHALVAGSTWPRDEAVLLDAFRELRTRRPGVRLILAPHEPTPERLRAIGRAATARGLPSPVPLAAMTGDATPEFVVVDRVGLLADLYAAGVAAYVGGGFGRHGLHSVLEPAAAARPIITGPDRRSSRDAALLERAGALLALPRRVAARALATWWGAWLDDPAACLEAGALARAVVRRGEGAADRTATFLAGLVRGDNGQRGTITPS